MAQSAFHSDSSSFSRSPGLGLAQGLVAYDSCSNDTLRVVFARDAEKPEFEHRLREILYDLKEALKETPEFRRIVIDLSRVKGIPDEARGGFLALVRHFFARDGATLCGASNETLKMWETMKIDRMYTAVDSMQAPPPEAAISKACDRLSEGVSRLIFNRAEIERTREPYPLPRELEYEGRFLTYRMEGSTAVATLNPSIHSLYEEWQIGDDFKYSVYAISLEQRGLERVVLDLSGLKFIGSTSIGTLIELYANGNHGEGPRIALCGLEKPVADVLHITQLDRILNVFDTSQAALAAQW